MKIKKIRVSNQQSSEQKFSVLLSYDKEQQQNLTFKLEPENVFALI